MPTGATLVRESVLATGDAVVGCGTIPDPGRQTLFLLTWQSRCGEGRSHYLAGKPPIPLDDYRAWTDLAGL